MGIGTSHGDGRQRDCRPVEPRTVAGSRASPRVTASLSIWLYPRDHAPPHFHVIGPDTAVLVDIRDLQVIAGTYRRKDLRIGLAWAAEHGDELRQAWENMHD